MVSIKTILSWFKTDLFPTEEQFKQAWTSFWHKSEKLPIEQTIGLKDALADKATKADVQNAITGTNLLDDKANEAEIKAITDPNKGDTHKASDTGDYWKYNAVIDENNPYSPDNWINIGKVIPGDVVTQNELENLDEATKAAQNLSIIQNEEFKLAITNNESVIWGVRHNGTIFDLGLSDKTNESVIELLHVIDSLDFATREARKLTVQSDNEFKLAITNNNTVVWGIRNDGTTFDRDLSDSSKTAFNAVYRIIDGANYNIKDLQSKLNISSDNEFLLCISNKQNIPIWGIRRDFSIFQAIESKSIIKKIIRAIGDSLTMGAGANQFPNFCYWLQKFLGDEYKVENHGVGGENTLTIAARMGFIPMYIDNDTFTMAGASTKSGIILKSVFDNSIISPLLQASIHMRVSIQGEEFRLGRGGGVNNYTLDRINSTGEIIIPKGAVILPAQASTDSFLDIIWIGTNDANPLDIGVFLEKLKLIDRAKQNNCIYIGIPIKDAKSPENGVPSYDGVAKLQELETVMKREFGSRYINLREYLITNALSDAGIHPTADDLVDMVNGRPPRSLLNDNVHYNEFGQKVIAQYIVRCIMQLFIQKIIPIY